MIKGVLTKMLTQFSNEIRYFLDFENEFLILNQLINKKIQIQTTDPENSLQGGIVIFWPRENLFWGGV